MRPDRAGLLLGCALLASCLAPMDPSAVPVASVRVTIGDQNRSVDTIQVRSTDRVHAEAIAREGYDIGLTRFAYSSSDSQVATVDTLGIVRGITPGAAVITATTPGGVSGSARVIVTSSTIAYTIAAGSDPGAIVFSPDYTRAYVVVGADSIAFLDALGFYRSSIVGLGARIGALATTGTMIYATHPDADSVSMLSAATKELLKRVWVGAGPDGLAAHGDVAFVAARYDHRIAVLRNGSLTGTIPVDGEPHALALSADGSRLYATVLREGAWHLLAIDAAAANALAMLPLDAEPADLAVAHDGLRVLVLEPAAGLLLDVQASAATGALSVTRTAPVSNGSGGVAMRETNPPYVIVSGAPLQLLDGASLTLLERIDGGGDGHVAVRPDGLFAFVDDRAAGVVRVIGL